MIRTTNGTEHREAWQVGQERPYPHAEPRRVLLLVTAPGTISERLIHAIMREFHWIAIEQVDDLAAARATFSYPVSLILIEARMLQAAEDAAQDLMRIHPQAITAIIDNDEHFSTKGIAELLATPLVRGVLPMNLRLDVWLAIIRLMLCGGEYYPSYVFLTLAEMADNSTGSAADNPSGAVGADLATLTAREIQILEMVSRGLQNKTIAAEFDLSEHTVKIHLHNIISKLGAHNRTEAAAKFRNMQSGKKIQATLQSQLANRDRVVGSRLSAFASSRNKT